VLGEYWLALHVQFVACRKTSSSERAQSAEPQARKKPRRESAEVCGGCAAVRRCTCNFP